MSNFIQIIVVLLLIMEANSAYTQNFEMLKCKECFGKTIDLEIPSQLVKNPQKLDVVFIPFNESVEVGDLRLWCGGGFIPERVGSKKGKITMYLRAGLMSTFHGDEGEELGADYQYYSHSWQDGGSYAERMKDYRWLTLEKNLIDKDKAGVKVYIDKLSRPDYIQYVEHLEKGEEIYFWLSTAGIQYVTFAEKTILSKVETTTRPEYAEWDSKDYFKIYISTHPQKSFFDSKKNESIKMKGLWGAKVTAYRKKTVPQIYSRSKDISLSRELGGYQRLPNYEFEVVKTKLGEGGSIKEGWFVMENLPNIHALIRVKRFN
ncbi:MAG: hypothetical protein GY810_29255 [Aureispira sp.]|nr:hypothetical protein [Aureispira sp.]